MCLDHHFCLKCESNIFKLEFSRHWVSIHTEPSGPGSNRISSAPVRNRFVKCENQILIQRSFQTVPVRRELSHRKAKGRSIAALMQKENDDDFDEPPEFADNDDDNDWMPSEIKVVHLSLDFR